MIVGALVLPLKLRGMTEGLTAKNPVKSTREWFWLLQLPFGKVIQTSPVRDGELAISGNNQPIEFELLQQLIGRLP